MSDSNGGGGIGIIGVVVVILIILLIFGVINFQDIWNVVVAIWDFCGAVCCGISVFVTAIVLLILGWRYFERN